MSRRAPAAIVGILEDTMRTMLIAALIGACTGQEGNNPDKGGSGDDTDPIADTDTDSETDTKPGDSGIAWAETDAPDPSQVYTVTGYVASVPFGTAQDGRPPWTILLDAVDGSLVVADGGRTFVQCLTFECGDVRPITGVELRCRLGDLEDPFGREVCQLVSVAP